MAGSLSRRTMLAASAATVGSTALAKAGARPLPASDAFLWGTAISAYQSEGNNTNTDVWLLENLPGSTFAEPSGDACDSFSRYEEDIALAARLGLNCYRFGIEWARIEPEEGRFSAAMLDHYRRVLLCCRRHGLLPIVTYSHFTVPLWFARAGGFEVAGGADLFATFAGRATRAFGDLIGLASTFNEANIVRLLRLLRQGDPQAAREKIAAMMAAAAKATDSPRFSSLLYADPDKVEPVLLDAHRKAYAAIKAAAPALPVGVTLTMTAIQPVGANSLAPLVEQALYGGWIDAARESDFVGVQTYTRRQVDARGALPPPAGAELTAAGYEFYPAALGETIRFAHRRIGKPIYVTESGIATDDDARRIAFVDAAVDEVARCRAEGIDVRSYIYWSLLDNFEWSKGYAQHFGLVAVDRTTFARIPKPSATHLAKLARSRRL